MKSILYKIFAWKWRKWLTPGDKIIKITGWNKAVIDDRYGQRRRTTFLYRGAK